jgi:hypothetical protein
MQITKARHGREAEKKRLAGRQRKARQACKARDKSRQVVKEG